MKQSDKQLTTVHVESRILALRGQKVILDSDLAEIYGVPTKRLNEQVRRNNDRFPEDFVFRLTAEEFSLLRRPREVSSGDLRSQIATSRSHGGRRYLPYAFTEHGAIMAANVLNSPKAVQMSVFVVRAFVRLRGYLEANQALADKLAELERKLTSRLDVHEGAILHVLSEIKKLTAPPPPEPKRRRIGFVVKDEPQ